MKKHQLEKRIDRIEASMPKDEEDELVLDGEWETFTEAERDRVRDAARILLDKPNTVDQTEDEQKLVREVTDFLIKKRGEFLEKTST
jgi:hypothetical protein